MAVLRPSFAALKGGAYGVHQSGGMLHLQQCLSKSINLRKVDGGKCPNCN